MALSSFMNTGYPILDWLPVDWWQIGWITTGFFIMLWAFKGRKKEKRYYLTEIPSKLVIEREA
jgi:hypothetical protein